jgi:hypothetical protein
MVLYLTQRRHKSLTLSVINASIAEVSTSGRGEPHRRLSRQPRDISTAQSSDSWEPTCRSCGVAMNSPQAVVLEGSSRTMIAHRLPTVPSTHSVAMPSTTHQEYVVSTTMNMSDTVSKIAKEVGEMLKDVPYVKAFAGIIIQIITIREVRENARDRDCFTSTRRSGNPDGEGSITGTHR